MTVTYTWSNNFNEIDWNELSELFRIAPLGQKSPEHLELVFNSSLFKFIVMDFGKIIGAGRALADGADCSYICDVVIHPEYQGMGIGKQLVKKLIDASSDHAKIIMYASPGKEGFYLSMGFKFMTTAMAIFKNETFAIESGVVK
jgi:ribosomal protein S18 acetylase RimI-like enzyme